MELPLRVGSKVWVFGEDKAEIIRDIEDGIYLVRFEDDGSEIEVDHMEVMPREEKT